MTGDLPSGAMMDQARERLRARLLEEMERVGAATQMAAAFVGYELGHRDGWKLAQVDADQESGS